jgi:polyisoprenoid-binding protein YceI
MILRIALLLTLMLPAAALARAWKVDPAHSTLGFDGSYQGEAFHGTFKAFAADIRYDPADLAHAKFDVSVDMTSVDTQSSERDDTLAGSDFFDSGTWPKAHFVTESFSRAADGGVEARGSLTIRDRSQPVTLKVTFTPQGDNATLEVSTSLDRQAFGLGTSADWNDIGKTVTVAARLALAGQ